MKQLARIAGLATVVALFLVGCGDSSVSSEENGVECGVSGMFRDVRDGQTYEYVTIDSTIWMTQNLNYAADSSQCYGGLDENCAQYGRLYLQHLAEESCPPGWVLPSYADAKSLIANGASALLASGTNTTGFSALLGGSSNGNMGIYGIYWISQNGYNIRVGILDNYVGVFLGADGELTSVRCVYESRCGQSSSLGR